MNRLCFPQRLVPERIGDPRACFPQALELGPKGGHQSAALPGEEQTDGSDRRQSVAAGGTSRVHVVENHRYNSLRNGLRDDFPLTLSEPSQ